MSVLQTMELCWPYRLASRIINEAAVDTLELHLGLYLFFILIIIITSMFLYYACKGPLVKFKRRSTNDWLHYITH